MTVKLYQVGPKDQEQPEHPWMRTGNKKVAEDYAEAMDGRVTVQEIETKRKVNLPDKWSR